MYSNETFSRESTPELEVGPQDAYEVLGFLGQGRFGEVSRARNRHTKEFIALKILHESEHTAFYYKKELAMLNLIQELDPDIFNVVKLVEHFEFDGNHCMAFEMLDQSVEELMTKDFSFSLNEIRPMAKQLFTTLLGLQSIGVVHSDIKPDNIMLVNQRDQPFRVKLIDFGVAKKASQLRTGQIIQPIPYRAPEVTLGLPLSEGVDMWSLACCLLLWHIGFRNVTSYSEFDNMKLMVDLLGTPDKLLDNGLYSKKYFVQEESGWRIKTYQEYKDTTGEDPEMYDDREIKTLEDFIMDPVVSESNIRVSDKEAFFDLLSKMFAMNPRERIKPVEALLHPFITMDHLPQGKSYTQLAHQYMCVVETDYEPLQREGLLRMAQVQNASRSVESEDSNFETESSASSCEHSMSQFEEEDSASSYEDSQSQFEEEDSASSYEDSESQFEDEGGNDEVTNLFAMTDESRYKLNNKYDLLEFLGEGSFGTVVKARHRSTKDIVALKAIKEDKNSAFYFKKEVEMLELIEDLDPDMFNIIEMIEYFKIDDHQFIAFEMLDKSVEGLMKESFSFSLCEIRPMTKQVLISLLGLQSIGVLHTDIKPDNIMLVNHAEQPFKVKLIDFGVAGRVDQAKQGRIMQPGRYRAPEVTLGLPLNEGVDMWSVAICLTIWYLGERSLVSYSEFDNLKMIMDMVGTPPDEVLSKGIYTNRFFVQEDSKWRLKTPEEFRDSTGMDPDINEGREITTLDELIMDSLCSESKIKTSDKEAFLDLLKKMLEINPEKRITPAEALLHPFITMDHLAQNLSYTEVAHKYMHVTETDFEPLQRENLQQCADMFIAKRQAKDVKRRIATPESSPAISQNAVDFNETGDSASSACLSLSNYDDSQLNDVLTSMESSIKATNVRFQQKSSGELSIELPDASDENIQVTNTHKTKDSSFYMEESPIIPSNELHQEESDGEITGDLLQISSGLSNSPTFQSSFSEAPFLVHHTQQHESNSDVEFALSLVSAKEELSADYSDILEDIEKLFAEEEQLCTEKKKASKSWFKRLRSLLSQLFRPLKPRPKKTFFRKPKWVKRISMFGGRSTTHGASTQ